MKQYIVKCLHDETELKIEYRSDPGDAVCEVPVGEKLDWLDVDVINKTVSINQIKKDNYNEPMKKMRELRDKKLSETDFTQLADAPLTIQQKSDYVVYRQELRDLPGNTVDPNSPIWPVKPS